MVLDLILIFKQYSEIYFTEKMQMTFLLKYILYPVFTLIPGLKSKFAGYWYQKALAAFPLEELLFMNYGYHDPDLEKSLHLETTDELNRYCIQLYHHLTENIPLCGRDVLEIGCGYGGGASYITRYLKPKSMTAVDANPVSVAKAQKLHRIPGLLFQTGNSEKLPFENLRFDIAVNAESSHCYASMKTFLKEVHRVLRPGGFLLWCDFRQKNKLRELKNGFLQTPFEIVREKDISKQVLAALDRLSSRRERVIDTVSDKPPRSLMREFAAVQDSMLYKGFKDRDYIYMSYALQKK